MRILIPTAGNRSLLISAFKNLSEVEKVVTTEIDEFAPGNFAAHKSYKVPRSLDPEYMDAIEALCIKEEIQIIFPWKIHLVSKVYWRYFLPIALTDEVSAG